MLGFKLINHVSKSGPRNQAYDSQFDEFCEGLVLVDFYPNRSGLFHILAILW